MTKHLPTTFVFTGVFLIASSGLLLADNPPSYENPPTGQSTYHNDQNCIQAATKCRTEDPSVCYRLVNPDQACDNCGAPRNQSLAFQLQDARTLYFCATPPPGAAVVGCTSYDPFQCAIMQCFSVISSVDWIDGNGITQSRTQCSNLQNQTPCYTMIVLNGGSNCPNPSP